MKFCIKDMYPDDIVALTILFLNLKSPLKSMTDNN